MPQQSLLEKKLDAARRRILSRLRADPTLSLIARSVLAALGGALLAGVTILDRPMPVCLALAAALPFGLAGVCAYLGAAGAYVLLYGASQALSILAAGFLIQTEQLIFRGLLPQDKRWFLPLCAAVLYGLIEFLELLQAHFAPEQTLLFLLRVALLALCSWQFSEALHHHSRRAQLFFALCLLAGSGCLHLPGSVRLSVVVGLAAAGYCLRLPNALPACAACALTLDLTGACAAPLTPPVCMAALLCTLLPWRGRMLQTAVLLLCCMAALAFSAVPDLPALAGCILGCALCLLLPQRLSRLLEADPAPDAPPAGLESASQLLRRVRRLLDRTQTRAAAPQSAAVFDRAAELACRDCPGWDTCWESCAADTYLALSGAAGRILQRGEALPGDLPPFFRARCCRYEVFLHAVDQALDEQTARLQCSSRTAALSAVAAAQYDCLADFLHALCTPQPLLTPLPAYRADVGFRACGVRGSNVCGDHAASFTNGEFFYLLLCDGMGTGPSARQESQTAAALLTGLIQSGMHAPDALKMLNGVYLLRGDGGFSTVDLLQISLVTGSGTLFKWGAAPSYLRAGRRVYTIGAAAPPPGAADDPTVQSQRIPLDLQRGQTLLLVSDGTDPDAAVRVLQEQTARSACELAAAVLAACPTQDDDRTAAVLTLRRTTAPNDRLS